MLPSPRDGGSWTSRGRRASSAFSGSRRRYNGDGRYESSGHHGDCLLPVVTPPSARSTSSELARILKEAHKVVAGAGQLQEQAEADLRSSRSRRSELAREITELIREETSHARIELQQLEEQQASGIGKIHELELHGVEARAALSEKKRSARNVSQNLRRFRHEDFDSELMEGISGEVKDIVRAGRHLEKKHQNIESDLRGLHSAQDRIDSQILQCRHSIALNEGLAALRIDTLHSAGMFGYVTESLPPDPPAHADGLATETADRLSPQLAEADCEEA